MIMKSCVGNFHGFLISAEGKEQQILHYATIPLDTVQNTKGMAVVNFTEDAALAQNQKKEELLPGGRL